jgi:hypothetical protein
MLFGIPADFATSLGFAAHRVGNSKTFIAEHPYSGGSAMAFLRAAISMQIVSTHRCKTERGQSSLRWCIGWFRQLAMFLKTATCLMANQTVL